MTDIAIETQKSRTCRVLWLVAPSGRFHIVQKLEGMRRENPTTRDESCTAARNFLRGKQHRWRMMSLMMILQSPTSCLVSAVQKPTLLLAGEWKNFRNTYAIDESIRTLRILLHRELCSMTRIGVSNEQCRDRIKIVPSTYVQRENTLFSTGGNLLKRQTSLSL